MTYHKDANSKGNPCPEPGKEQQRIFATRLDKIIFNASNA